MIAIYIDVYFFLNLAIDYLSLYSSAKLIALPFSTIRALIAATLGGTWSVIVFFVPQLSFLNIPFAFIIALISNGIKKIFKKTTFFLFFEMVLGGIIMGIKKLFCIIPQEGLGLTAIITICIIFSFLIFEGFEAYVKKRIYTISIPVYIRQGDNKKRLSLFIDSGNLAREVSTGRRLIFVKASTTGFTTPNIGVFAIPVKTAVGTKIKFGFIPDEIRFNDKKYNKENYIVVPDSEGCEFGGYDGIIGVI